MRQRHGATVGATAILTRIRAFAGGFARVCAHAFAAVFARVLFRLSRLGFASALLALALAGSPARAAGTVEERLDRLEAGQVQLTAQVTVLSGKIDALYWLLVGGFGFLGLVILFRREQPTQPPVPQADPRALEALVEQAVQRALAQRGAREAKQ